MRAYLNLIRWKNLIIIAATMFIMKYLILIPVSQYFNTSIKFCDIGFLFLTVSIMFIAAAGNVINDYFDRKTDYINKPEKVIVGFTVKRRIVIAIHLILSFLGILTGFIAAYLSGQLRYGLIFILLVYILWKYSTSLKRTVFWGNFTVGVLTAIVPALVALFEYVSFKTISGETTNADTMAMKVSLALLLGYAVFAFAYNFIREIVKDLEDMEGDSKTGVKTMAVAIGKDKTNSIVSVLSTLSAAAVITVWITYISKLPFLEKDIFSTLYIIVLIVIPTLYITVKSLYASKKRDYTYLSKLLKIIMIFGILYSVIISLMIYGAT